KAVLDAKPTAYFRMADMAGPRAADASGNGNHGRYEDGVVFWLPGPGSAANAITGSAERINRAAHFAGGRLRARAPGETYTVEMWVWNGMPAEARDAAGILFFAGRGDDEAAHPTGDCVWIGGKGEHAGKLMAGQEYSFTAAGNWRSPVKVIGKTRVPDRTWAHVAIVRGKQGIRLYLNGQLEAEGQPGKNVPGPTDEITLGGAGTKAGNTLEGRLDEVAIYARELSGEEIAAHFKAAAVMAQAPVTPPQGTAPLPQPVATASASPAAYKRSAEPLSPPESLKKIHVGPEYAIELVAHEPLVVDPVAIDWGYDGKLWVVEFADYPYGMDGKGSAGGRIKFLTDTDGDGKYDKATLFMDGVKMPTGVMAWRKGVIVAAAPEIFYAEDTDGDGKADRREVLYKGFKEGNPQLRVNALRWGLDSWVYVSNGLSGGTVESIRGAAKGKPVAPVDIKNKDLRVRPDTGEMELVSGPSQWGRARDAFGRWFGTHNAQPLFHLTLEDRYLRRNPDVTYPDVRRQLLPMPMPPLFPKSAFAKRYIGLDHHGHFTSGSGISVETTRLTAGGTEPVIRAYVCDPVHNLVQAQELSEAGASFAAARVAGAGTADFVAGEDPWFRPVMTRPGPDGALWVVDMYRYMIEHPDWLNEQGKRELAPFYRDGDDRGRIYRVYRKGLVLKPMPTIRLTDSRDALVEQLTSGSAVVRDLAHRAIVWQVADGGGIDASLREKLEHLIEKSESSAAQAQAIGLLDGAGGVTPAFANRLLGLRHPGLLALAVRVAERFEWKAVGPRLSEIAATTSDPGVRAQVACTLGQFENAEAGAVLAGLAAVDADDAILAAAIASAAKPHEKVLVDRVLATPALAGKPLADYLLTMAVRRKDTATVGRFADKLLADANPPAAQMDALAKLAEVLGGRGMSLADLDKPVGAGRIERLRAIVKSATRRAADERAAPADRRAATELLGRLPERRAADLATAAALLVPRTPAEVQLAAVRAVARTQDPAAPQALLAAWPSLSPAVRVAIADALMAREPWAAELAKSPAARELDFARKQRLLNHKSAVVKDAAKATLAATGPGAAGDRQKVIDEYAEAMRLAPDLKHGQQVYAEQCATCHQVGSLADAAGKVLGNDIGPNLLTVRDWTKESLLAGILDPDRTVAPQFIAYNATTAGGDQHTGLIVAESAGGISIRTVDGRVQEIPRGSLKSLVSTGRSLMPQGFESALSPQDVADLMGFITDPARR
ncbi:MAG TPA: PVC-type heme-binding CxxCH protein, partial [Tepidisphaeraceae bacterium]|nr:PVC-type heme-binding CxxCH protein [Tepidisphaeraceae bacterium]